jgi:RNA polymerase sigma factor, sigma-70 family
MPETIDINSSNLSIIKANNQRKITELYNEHKAPFINYSVNNFKLARDTAEDIYQDAFLALHQNIQNGKLVNLTVPLRTYLFQIGKNKIYDYFKKVKVEVDMDDISNLFSAENELGDFDSIYADEEETEQRNLIVYNTVSQMESPCKEVLSYYYWDDKSMKEIADLMNYSSSDVAKTQKSKCMKKVRVYIMKRLRNER